MKQTTALAFLLATAVLLPMAGLAAAERVISVAPGGDLAAAVEKAEAILPEARSAGDSVVVELADGMYELEETLVLTPKINGTPVSPTIFRAADGARPVISGGRVLSGFTVGDDGYWHLTIDAVKNGDWYFQQLYVNNRRAERPRLPKEGWYTVAGRFPEEKSKAEADPGEFITDMSVYFSEGDITSNLHALNDIDLCCPQYWVMTRHKITSVDDAKKIIHLSTNFFRAAWYFEKGRRFFLDNVREALGTPGQFYLDRAGGNLVYIPREGESIENATVIAPRLEILLALSGGRQTPVENVRFEGLTFAYSGWTTGKEGNNSNQAEIKISSAVQFTCSRGITLEGCGFHSLGNYGLLIGTACKNCAVTACAFRDLGGGGIRIGGNLFAAKGFSGDYFHDAEGNFLTDVGGLFQGEYPFDDSYRGLSVEELLPEGNTVRDCLMEYLGRVHAGSIGIGIQFAANTLIERCEVFDTYYSAVSIGWTWGLQPDPAPAVGNIVRQCHLHKIGQRFLSDMGAVYTLGASPGTKVTHNLIHDVTSYEFGGWGLYTDGGSTYIEMAHNIVYDTQSGSFYQDYGRDNYIHHNLLVNSQRWQLIHAMVEEHCPFRFEYNVVYWDSDAELLSGPWIEGDIQMNHNIYWNTAAKENLMFKELSFAQWRKLGRDTDALLADPRLRDPAHGDFTLEEDSPAADFGIEVLEHYGPAARPTICDDIPAPGACFPLPVPGTEPAATMTPL
ncbi:MAG: right-handed parallel beta-helix repeat-containing protein [Thermoguttaceae bacterium]|nr:right-handed parallel beta-helix repeat-containing protein [Thermoguttaceae bacterium]